MEIDKEKFKKKYPNIAKELEKSDNKVKISSVKIDEEINNTTKQNTHYRGHNPSVIDFIRRCNNTAEAEEIISYLENRGEISEEYAGEIRKQLKNKGIRSFGSKKQNDYYFRNIETK